MAEQLAEAWHRAVFAVAVWVESRPPRRLLAGGPAALLGITIAVALISQRAGDPTLARSHYNHLLSEALVTSDMAAAELWARKLVQLDPASGDARFAQAWLARRRGDRATAARLAAALAPDDRAGHPRAHLWRAEALLQETRSQPLDVEIVIHHLQQAMAEPSQKQSARVTLAKIYLAAKDHRAAIEQLAHVVHHRPALGLQLSQLYALVGDRRRSRAELDKALDYFRSAAEQHPTDVELQILWAQAEAAAGDDERAESILLAALHADHGSKVRRALAALCVARSDRLRGETAERAGERLELLARAVHYMPNDHEALLRVAALVRADNPSHAARQLLHEALARGEAPALIHLLLGTIAASDSDWQVASMHLTQARQLNPDSPVLLNNLAWVLASGDPPQPELALPLVNAALKLLPRHAEIHATRGRVLMLLERWPEALADFEIALPELAGRASLHQSLARIYEQLGDPQLAQQHRDLAVPAPPAALDNAGF